MTSRDDEYDDEYEDELDDCDPSEMQQSDDGHHLLHVFRDLILLCPASRLDDITSAISARIAPPWRRAPEHDRTEYNTGLDWRVFGRETDDQIPGCLLFLAPNSRFDHIYVSNIVPTDRRSLGVDGYNAVLTEFTDQFAGPAAGGLDIRCELSDDWADFAASLGGAGFTALRAAALHKPGTHPSDRERWMSFIVTTYRGGVAVDAELLRRWLVADGFSQDRAWQLSTEFDFATDLLKLNDRL